MGNLVFAVDDCDMNLTVVEHALKSRYTVYCIESIDELFTLLGQMIPEAILLDFYMPDMTCCEVFERLKADTFYADIPVIVMSGARATDIKDECMSMGAVHFIPKPILDPVDFLAQVKQWAK